MKWTKYHTGLAACIILFFIIGFILVQPEAQKYNPYLSFSPDLDGTKAFTMLLDEQGYATKEWRQSWRFLPTQTGQVLIVIQPYYLYETEQEAIIDWLHQGNELIIVDYEPRGWPGIDNDYVGSKGVQRGIHSVYFDGARPMAGDIQSSYRLRTMADDYEVIIEDAHGPIAVSRPIGDGRLTIAITPNWLTNNEVLEHNHFELMWPLFKDQDWEAVWIDEYHHGYQSRPGLFAVYPDWLIVAGAQLTIVLLLWLWWKGKRFGPIYTLREWIVRRGDETLLAIASWYERKRLNRESFHHQMMYVRQLINERWGIPHNATHNEVIHRAKQHWEPKHVEALHDLLNKHEHIKRDVSYKTKQLVKDSQRVNEIIKQLEKE